MSTRSLLQKIKNPWTQLSIRRQGFIVVAVPLVCLVGSLGAFSWLQYSIDTSQRWVDHTNEVLLESHQLLNGLLRAETGVRGYALTRQPEFLKAYYTAQTSFAERLNHLKLLVADNLPQQQRIAEVGQLMEGRFAALANLLEQIEQSDAQLPLSELSQRVMQGKAEMNRLDASLMRFEQEEQRLLQRRVYDLNEQRNFNEIALWAAAILSALGSAFALSLFSQLDRNLQERELRLRESKTLIEAIVSNIVDGVVVLDRRGQIESINAATSALFGYTLDQTRGKALSFLLNDPMPTHSPDSGHGSGLSDERQLQATGRSSSGSLFPIELSISQIPLDARLLVIIRDVTERQQAAAKLQSRADALTQLNVALATANTALKSRNLELDQFAYVASHDLKAPLRAIASLSEWIEEDLAGHIPLENKRQLYLLRSRVHRMEALINGLLDYSRIGRTKIPVEPIDLRALLDEIIEMLPIPSTFTIEIKIDPHLAPFQARRLLLRQVLINLIDNAFKHHPRADGRISIAVTHQESCYEFVVQDDGNGIDPSYHDKIFTIFQTLKARDTQENTGIGLAIIKKIIETEGGSIGVESHEGEGAIFRFSWPKPLI